MPLVTIVPQIIQYRSLGNPGTKVLVEVRVAETSQLLQLHADTIVPETSPMTEPYTQNLKA